MSDTKIYSKLVSGIEGNYVTDITLIEDTPVAITATELRILMAKGLLEARRRYLITDYQGATSFNYKDFGVLPTEFHIQVIVTAENHLNLREDVELISKSLPDAHKWKAKYDIEGKNHIFYKDLESLLQDFVWFNKVPGVPLCWWNEKIGLAITQYEPGENFDINQPFFFVDYEIIGDTFIPKRVDFNQPIRADKLSLFQNHNGVITWMKDSMDNEAYFDFVSFISSERPDPIIPLYGVHYFEDTAICRNNKIGPYYINGKLNLPKVYINMGENMNISNNIVDAPSDYTLIIGSGSHNTFKNSSGEYKLVDLSTLVDSYCNGEVFNSRLYKVESASFLKIADSILEDVVLQKGFIILSCDIRKSTLSYDRPESYTGPDFLNCKIDTSYLHTINLCMNINVFCGNFLNCGFADDITVTSYTIEPITDHEFVKSCIVIKDADEKPKIITDLIGLAEPIFLTAMELRELAFLDRLVPEQRYVITDYGNFNPGLFKNVFSISYIQPKPHVAPGISIMVRASSTNSLYEDAVFYRIDIPYKEKYKLKFDLWGLNHIFTVSTLNPTIPASWNRVGLITLPNGKVGTHFMSLFGGLNIYQLGDLPGLDINLPWGLLKRVGTGFDFEDFSPTHSFAYLADFPFHNGVITWIKDFKGNEAYCDWVNFDVIIEETAHPILPVLGADKVKISENNSIGLTYTQYDSSSWAIGFPLTGILDSSNVKVINNYAHNKYLCIYLSKDSTIIDSSGHMQAIISSTVENCDFQMIGGREYVQNSNLKESIILRNTSIDNSNVSYSRIETNLVGSTAQLRIFNSDIVDSTIIQEFKADLTIRNCKFKEVIFEVWYAQNDNLVDYAIDGNGFFPHFITSMPLPVTANIKALNNFTVEGSRLIPDTGKFYMYKDIDGIIKTISDDLIGQIFTTSQATAKIIEIAQNKISINQDIAIGEKVIFKFLDPNLTIQRFSQTEIRSVPIAIVNESTAPINIGPATLLPTQQTTVYLRSFSRNFTDSDILLILNKMIAGAYMECIFQEFPYFYIL